MAAHSSIINGESFDTIIIGAGQAGLATGHYLAARDRGFVILDGASRIGDSWRERWDSLRLFTTAAHDGLPGMPFPPPAQHLPDKDEVADYLEEYAQRFNLPLRLNAHVDLLTWNGERYIVHVGERRLAALNTVVATGSFQRPRTPAVAARLSPQLYQLHSSQYRNPSALPAGPVLVVGAGNSGVQIALELARSRHVWLAGRTRSHIPRRLLGRDVFDWLWPLMARIPLDSLVGRVLRTRMRRGDLLVGNPASEMAREGIVRVGRLTEERGGLPVCGGVVIEPRVVLWCTGFESGYRWIKLPVLDGAGAPRHHGGVALDSPGLYFMGLRFQRRLTSSLLGGVGEDAKFITERISQERGLRQVSARPH
ncbi:MAG TPA: NAD(P)/FAD-dependent oxidoreductase [Gemmatimonadaceae bacterium]|nr:NAD(P)/FAD-dependent oxidoreductase [Gemmatimonadaceae bacterium]